MDEVVNKSPDPSHEDLKRVEAVADEKQRRHRVDEYMAMIIALGAVALLWFFQYAGFY